MESNQSGYYRIYTDGGLTGRNPARGGMYAWVYVEGDTVIASESGMVMPSHFGREFITNNQTELTAIYRALRALPDGWQGQLWSDSECAVHWVDGPPGMPWGNVPKDIRRKVIDQLNRIRKSGGSIEFRHLNGHMDKSEFHKYNVMCDRMCNEERRKYEEKQLATQRNNST